MSDPNRFFRVINRVNSILLFIIFMTVVVGIVFIYGSEFSLRNKRTIEVQTTSEKGEPEKVSLQLGRIEQVEGAPVQFVKLESQDKRRGSYVKGSPHTTRNVLFLSNELKEARWLFPSNGFVIAAFHQIRVLEGQEGLPAKGPCKAIYYEVVKQDSNGDQRLSADDKAVAALSKVDGSGYAELTTDAQRIIGYKAVNQGTELAVMLEKDGKIIYQTYSLDTFAKISETCVADIPSKF